MRTRASFKVSVFAAAAVAACVSAASAQVDIQARLARYQADGEALNPSDPDMRNKAAALRDAVWEGVDVGRLSPADLAALFRAGVLFHGGRRDGAIARLESFRGDDSHAGASAAVLRFELLANPFVWFDGGERLSYRPEPSQAGALLDELLAHPALIEAAIVGDLAAAYVHSAVAGIEREDLWLERREEIEGLAWALVENAHPRVYADLEDYIPMLRRIGSIPDDESQKAFTLEGVSLGRSALRSAGANGHELGEDEAEWITGVLDRLHFSATVGDLIGKQAPALDFEWANAEGLRSLDDVRGKVTVLDFWTVWCVPCVASFPKVRDLRAHYEGLPVEIIGVTSLQGTVPTASGEMVDCAGDAAREHALMRGYIDWQGISWTVAFSAQDAYNPEYGISGLPFLVILDPEGKVRHAGLHPGEDYEGKLEKINAILAEYGLPRP